MDKQLDIRFDRVERALSTLVDSIAKYNPSIPSAQDLVAADAELGKGLEERTCDYGARKKKKGNTR